MAHILKSLCIHTSHHHITSSHHIIMITSSPHHHHMITSSSHHDHIIITSSSHHHHNLSMPRAQSKSISPVFVPRHSCRCGRDLCRRSYKKTNKIYTRKQTKITQENKHKTTNKTEKSLYLHRQNKVICLVFCITCTVTAPSLARQIK